MIKIAHFEALAEQLVEGTFARLFAGRISPQEVATHLIRAMEDNQVVRPDGDSHAPTHYWVYLHPDDHAALAQEQPMLAGDLVAYVIDLAAQAGMTLKFRPRGRVLPDEDGNVEEAPEMEKTREMEGNEVESEAEAQDRIAPPGRPFLILEGRRHVNLLKPVVSVGRALDNEIIIEDPRVSRRHAQLRRRYGRYVLYDLGSSGGTQINGYPIEECVLQAGDVISFAGVQVIYSEDPPTSIPLPNHEDTPQSPSKTPPTHHPAKH